MKADLFKWKSSNKGIVTVSSKGIIRAKKAGSAYITASRGKKNIPDILHLVNQLI